MKDFTTKAYQCYLNLVQQNYSTILTLSEYFASINPPRSFCLIRHDVDRNPMSALRMAELESDMGLRSTYYFRTKRNVFIPKIIKNIFRLGHEIGYHYESLADCKGDHSRALADFEHQLLRLREHVPITTIAMHGRPLAGIDNRDLWKSKARQKMLKSRFKIQGEVYLDIDYSDIAYISDTGRNWNPGRSNIQDTVRSHITPTLNDHASLINYLKEPDPKMVFLTHPERWQEKTSAYLIQLFKDAAINLIKRIL